MGGRGGGRGGRGEANGGARTRARTRPRACSPPSGPSARAFPGSPETRAGAGPVGRAAREAPRGEGGGGGELRGGRCGCAGARVRARARPVEAAPPLRPRPGVWLRARACVPAVRAGRDAEVKFGREGERSVSAREPEWPPLLSPARRRAQGKGGGTGPPLVAGGRVGGWVTRLREL